ncbi:MAG: hybrid sensor histidine kinase/response regulator [Candidatus Desulfofervidaceae bacterium]|nr:hybrid sensor histidine kinase/response regulator [Candidatus Desulfofervidaceae bacterium]
MLKETNPPTIMIVDDDPDSIRLLELALRPLGYQIDKAYNAAQALEILTQSLPDLILLDVLLPDAHGFELCKIIKGKLGQEFLPIIMVTALSSRGDKIQGLQAGADDFISKPIDIPELVAKINALLRTKILHRRLQQSYEKLKKLEETKELLVRMIIHDLKNPLTALVGSLELLALKTKGTFPPDVPFSPQNALRITERILRLIQNLLDITKMEEGKIQLHYSQIDIAELFKEVTDMFKAEATQKGALIQHEIEGEIPPFKADRDLLLRVLENLVSNALKNLPDRGEKEGTITLKATLDTGKKDVVVMVIDNGYGIPKSYLSKIFDKFAQIEIKKKQGKFHTGLGLPFCKLAIEAHGGRIWVESKSGKGSTFSFTLPLNVRIKPV